MKLIILATILFVLWLIVGGIFTIISDVPNSIGNIWVACGIFITALYISGVLLDIFKSKDSY